jgi:hypothetical protein
MACAGSGGALCAGVRAGMRAGGADGVMRGIVLERYN